MPRNLGMASVCSNPNALDFRTLSSRGHSSDGAPSGSPPLVLHCWLATPPSSSVAYRAVMPVVPGGRPRRASDRRRPCHAASRGLQRVQARPTPQPLRRLPQQVRCQQCPARAGARGRHPFRPEPSVERALVGGDIHTNRILRRRSIVAQNYLRAIEPPRFNLIIVGGRAAFMDRAIPWIMLLSAIAAAVSALAFKPNSGRCGCDSPRCRQDSGRCRCG